MTDLNKVCQWLFNVFLLLLVLPQFKGYAPKRFLMEKKELQQKITIATSHTEKHREKEIEKTGRDPTRRRDRGQLNTRGWRRVMNWTAAANQAEIHVNHHTNQIMSTSSVLKKFSKEIPKLSGDEQLSGNGHGRYSTQFMTPTVTSQLRFLDPNHRKPNRSKMKPLRPRTNG